MAKFRCSAKLLPNPLSKILTTRFFEAKVLINSILLSVEKSLTTIISLIVLHRFNQVQYLVKFFSSFLMMRIKEMDFLLVFMFYISIIVFFNPICSIFPINYIRLIKSKCFLSKNIFQNFSSFV